MPPTTPFNTAEGSFAADEINLYEVASTLLGYWWQIALATAASAIVAFAGSYLTRPVFRAEVLVAPVMDQRQSLSGVLATQLGGLGDLTGIGISRGVDRASALATLRSRVLTEQFLKERDLMPILFKEDWDPEAKTWRSESAPTLLDGYQVIDKSIRQVRDDKRSGLVTVAVEWHDPAFAADWANDLIHRANARLQASAIAEGQSTVAYIESQLREAKAVEIRQALYNVIEAEMKQIAVAHARTEFAFKVIDPAVAPERRVRPNRVLAAGIGFLSGFSGSVVFVLVLTKLRSDRGKLSAVPKS